MTGTRCLRWLPVVVFLAGSVGCGGGSPTKAPAGGNAPAAGGTAPPGAKQNKDARGDVTSGPPGGFKQGE